MTNLFVGVVMGVGLGGLLSVAGQKHLNQRAIETCNAQPDYHRVVTLTSWVGDAKYCMHIRYLAQ